MLLPRWKTHFGKTWTCSVGMQSFHRLYSLPRLSRMYEDPSEYLFIYLFIRLAWRVDLAAPWLDSCGEQTLHSASLNEGLTSSRPLRNCGFAILRNNKLFIYVFIMGPGSYSTAIQHKTLGIQKCEEAVRGGGTPGFLVSRCIVSSVRRGPLLRVFCVATLWFLHPTSTIHPPVFSPSPV